MADDVNRLKKKRAWQIGCGLAAVIGLVLAWPVLKLLKNAYDEGFFDRAEKIEYNATSIENMKALWQAMELYHVSEGEYPHASGWMDAAKPYLKTADLLDGEEMKKLVNPNLPASEDVFGYAMNSELSQAYKDEVEDPARTPLIFDSGDTSWNAFGLPGEIAPDPELPGGNRAVTVDGAVVLLRELTSGTDD